MLKKIPFNVVFASDEDPAFPASELNTHGPTVHGWRSAAGSVICPHDIIIRFHKPAKVCRIQILAHQYLIPEKVELWLHYSPKSMPSTPSSQCFDFLGFVALSDNAETNYKSRELQSVTVNPRRGTHLKLRLSAAHCNECNASGQIALMAVNVLGQELGEKCTAAAAASEGATTEELEQQALEAEQLQVEVTTAEPTLASICDDLLFSMYVEETIGDYIREMESKKAKAVAGERFEYARKLKLCMTALRTAGERLGRYALAKRQAVQQEDFTTANLRKEQMEMYKAAVFKRLLVHDLLEPNAVAPKNDLPCEVYASKPVLPPAPSLQYVSEVLNEAQFAATMSPKSTQDDKSSTDGGSASAAGSIPVAGGDNVSLISQSTLSLRRSHDEIPMSPKLHVGRSPSRHSSPMSSRQGSLRRRNRSAPRNSFEDYDERAIPTMRHSSTNEFLRECHGTALLEADSTRGRSRLNDRERRQAALPILIFGIDLVEQFYSRQFQDREDGLVRLRKYLKEQENESATNPNSDLITSPNKVARSAALLLHRTVRDAVFSVFSQATETVRILFLDYIPERVSQSEVARCVDRLLPELLTKSGDPSARIHTLAQHTILSIAACPEVAEQHLVAPALSRSVGSATAPRLAMSRMQMLEQLVLSQGISPDKHSGLTCRALAECGASGIHHPAEPVRKVAERILLLVYKVKPRMVRKQLPPDDDVTRRNLLYRHLFTEFDKLDAGLKLEAEEGMKYNEHSGSNPTSPPSNRSNDGGNRLRIASGERNSSPNGFRTKTPERQPSPLRCSGMRLESESKRGTSATPGTSNGHAASGSKMATSLCNGKQQYNEQLKRSMLSAGGKPNSRRGSQSNSNSESLQQEPKSLHCPFCDWSSRGSDQAKLDRHFWKTCPYLTKCPQCSQVLEVAALNYHLTNECEAKDSFVTCDSCKESVHKQLYYLHEMEGYCRELSTGAARCPLCHDDVHLPLDGGWKLHLLSPTGCPGNSRRHSKRSNN